MLYRQKSKTDSTSMFKSLARNLMVLLCSNYYQDILIETEKIMVMRNKAAGLWIFLIILSSILHKIAKKRK